eukprot:TRINITY_DN8915_c0_g2_i1.p1 TRINITY_DN8915_c0_g2~~TRINITY_DN8915_c0_g2_i1.p1  ORF type:complete len:299 (+),score=97.95 TRINITY_DN8915_c0_g2_i1:383-1279(+)
MNFNSVALTKSEAKKMRESFTCSTNFLRSYKLQLNFYGIAIKDIETGQLERNSEWEFRYSNLTLHTHNYLRISRIIMSLGELGFVRYKKPLVTFFQTEIEENGQLEDCSDSYRKFWRPLAFDEDSASYALKTRESPSDRSESVFFTHMAQQTDRYREWEAGEQKWETELREVWRVKAQEKIEEDQKAVAKGLEARERIRRKIAEREQGQLQKQQQKQQQKQASKQKQEKKEKKEEEAEEAEEAEEEEEEKHKKKKKKKKVDIDAKQPKIRDQPLHSDSSNSHGDNNDNNKPQKQNHSS